MKVSWAITALLVPLALQAQINVTTNRYDPERTGANLSETTLTTTNVNAGQFGKLYSYPVDGAVYAQPLYVSDVTISGTPRNVLYVATMNDKVYAFDADSASPSPLWMRDFTSPPSVTAVPITDIVADNLNIVGNVGIHSTPVIDPATGTIYLLARTKESGAYVQRLHALDIRTGLARPGSPVTITGSVPGNAPDSTLGANGRFITFNPKMQSQRAGLALSNGVVLVAWASHEDANPFHGWVMGFDATSLARVGIFAVTPDVYAGGIWQGGRAPAIDAAGNAYFSTGNGTWDGTRNFGDSLLKVGVSTSGLTLLDYFTPGNEAALNTRDDDLSGSGFTLLPGGLLLGGGKEGPLYLIDANNLGHKVANDTQIVQKLSDSRGHVMGGPVYWSSASAGPLVYNWSEEDVLKAYRFSGGRLVTPPYALGQVVSPGHPGGSLTISANGGAADSGIVWVSMPTNEDAIHGLHAGILRAYDAETLLEIWTSERDAGRDRVGTLMKFVPPVVANGRVYLPNHDNAVVVYGLLPEIPPSGGSRAIGINFVGTSPSVMDPAEAAGVFPASHWNNAIGGSRSTPLALTDDTGAGTSATVTWSAGGGPWMLPIADQPGNLRMMKGYLDTSSTSSTTITVAGLPQRAYDVYVYADGDNRTFTRGGAYTLSGPGIATSTINLTDPANTNFSSTFTRADNSNGNYVRFRVTAAGFTLTAAPTTPASGTRRAPVNAVQIVPILTAGPDFTIAATPSSRTVTAGGSTTYSVTVAAQNGFTGAVSLAAAGAPPGTTTMFSPASVTGGGTSTLIVTTGAATPANTVSLTVTGSSGTLSHSTNVALTVTAPPPPAGGAGTIGIDFVGSTPTPMAASETAGVAPASHWNSAVGAARSTPLALIDNTGAATSATATWSGSGGVWMLPITDAAGNARLMKGYLDTNTTSATTVTVAGLPQRAYDVYVYADGDNKVYARGAAYTLSGAGITTSTINLLDSANTNFSSSFTQANNSSGNYVKFSITATGFTLTAAPTSPDTGTRRAPVNAIQIVPVAAPDFTIAATPGSRSVTAGASTTYSVTVAAQNGFTGTVSFAVSGIPSGTSAAFSPASVTAAGGSTLTVTTTAATPPGTSTLTVRGTSGSLSRSTTVTLTVTGTAPRPSIGIDFVGGNTVVMGASEIAGVVPKSHWNAASGAARSTPLALVDEFGAATTAAVTWAASGTWRTPITDQAGNRRMMKGYLDTTSTSVTTLTVTGLPAGAYDVYVYVDGHNYEFDRTAAYRTSGSGITGATINLTDAAYTNFDATFVQAQDSPGNYVKFSINATGFTLTAIPGTGGNATLRAPVNGIQIVPK